MDNTRARATDCKLREGRLWLQEWRSIDAFEQKLDALRPGKLEYRERAFKFWREGWVAAQFVRRSGQLHIRVRLTREGDPTGDFQLRDHKGEHNYEIAEALDPSMPPALKRIDAQGGTIYHESPEAVSGELARSEIWRLIGLKATKEYPPGTSLVLYINLWNDFERAGLSGLVPAEGEKFKSIWLLAQGRAIMISPARQ